MSQRSMKVRIVKESNTTVTVFFPSLNRKLPIPRATFHQRVDDGLYEVIETFSTMDEE